MNARSEKGRTAVRVTPRFGFMDGKRAAALFSDHSPDPKTAGAIERELAKLQREENEALANRY